MIVIYVPFLFVDGLALCPFVFVRRRKNSVHLLNHERIHIWQQIEMGLILFYIWYILEFFIRWAKYGSRWKAYRNISFEREAYKHDTNINYLKKRRFWAFLKYI